MELDEFIDVYNLHTVIIDNRWILPVSSHKVFLLDHAVIEIQAII